MPGVMLPMGNIAENMGILSFRFNNKEKLIITYMMAKAN